MNVKICVLNQKEYPMRRIAITGSLNYVKESKIRKAIRKIYEQYGDTATILSGGTDRGPETWVKKYALEFGLKYKEYNPSYTGQRMYSALDESYYGKGYHMSHTYDRYKRMLWNTDDLVVFLPENWKTEEELVYLLKLAKKRNIKTLIVR